MTPNDKSLWLSPTYSSVLTLFQIFFYSVIKWQKKYNQCNINYRFRRKELLDDIHKVIVRQIFYLFLFCTNRSLKLTTFFCRNWLIQAYHEGEVSFILRDRQKKWVFLSFKLIVLGLSLFEMTTCHLQLGRLLYESERFPVEEFMQLINK